MKKTITFLFFLSLFSSDICFSQSGWFWQNPYPQGNYLNSVRFANSSIGYAVGYKGTVIKTTNGGINWTYTLTDNQRKLNSIFPITIDTLFACGDMGLLMKSVNGGINWQILNLRVNVNLYNVFFVGNDTGLVVGENGTILKTTNRGKNWISITSVVSADLYSIFFLNSQTGYICGPTYILKTLNGGNNWSILSDIAGKILKDIQFIDVNTGYVAGSYYQYPFNRGFLCRTTDGGMSWNNINLPFNNMGCTSLKFKDFNTGFVTAMNLLTTDNNIITTTNAGIDWIYFSTYSLSSSCIVPGNIAVAVGVAGAIVRTTNFGLNWINISNPYSGFTFYDIIFPDGSTGYICGGTGDSIIIKTTNGGLNWFEIGGPKRTVFSLFFTSNNTGYAVGGTNIVYKTTNGGINWIAQQINSSGGLRVVYFINQDTGYAGGYNSSICKTTNGGINWGLKYYGTGTIKSISFLTTEIGYALEECLKTTNGGETWFYDNILPNVHKFEVFFINPNTGFISTAAPSVIKTTDSGLNWYTVLQTNSYITEMGFADIGIGYITCSSGKIYKSTDWGSNWLEQYSITDNQLNDLFVINENLIYCVGDFKTIIKTTNGGGGYVGINFNETKVPTTPSLSQNYPNPFNPVTRIKYDIPAVGQKHAFDVRLIIYDILGREIETLVNETQKPGSYEVAWDGSSYASGVYFYKLITENFSECKRMVLIK